MASRNLARLGVVLGIDTAEWEKDINAAIAANGKLKSSIKADMNAAEREIVRLKFATEDYGKTLTQVDIIQREINNGRYVNATQQAKDALLAQARAYDSVANSAKKAGFAMSDQQKIQLSYQTTDLVTQIASGSNPAIALLQQGGQLKDVMGGFGNMFRALGTLFTPLNIALGTFVAGLGGMAVAAYKGAEDLAKLRDALILTNNIAGVTNGSFYELSKTISEKTNLSIGNTKEALIAVAGSGQFAAQSIKPVTELIATYAKIAGISGKEAADKLIPSLDGSASSAARMNSTFHFLTLEQYKHIEVLAKQGKTQESIAYTADLLNKSLSNQVRELDGLDKALEKVKNGWSSFWNAAKESLAPETLEQKIEKLRKRIESVNPAMFPGRAMIMGDSDASDQENLRLLQKQLSQRNTVILNNAEEIAKKAKETEDYIFAGGDAKATALRIDLQKQELKTRFDMAKINASEIEKVNYDANEKTINAINELNKKNEAERGVFAIQNAQVLEQQLIQIEVDRQEKVRQLQIKYAGMRADSLQEEAEAVRRASAEAVAATQAKTLALEQQNKMAGIGYKFDQQKMSERNKMFGATQKEIDLMSAQIDRQKELALIEADASEQTVKQIELRKAAVEAAYRNREVMAELNEQMRKAGQVHEAVFGEMEKALEDFVKNGKLSFSDLTRNIIQNLMLIEMKLQATALFKAGLKAAGGFLGEVFDTNIFSNLFGAKAAGGPVQGGASYLVGENGPEIFTSPSSGTIIPNHALAMGGGGQTINYNGPFIQNMSAIDTQSGIAFLSKNKQAVWAANQSAQRSLPVSR